MPENIIVLNRLISRHSDLASEYCALAASIFEFEKMAVSKAFELIDATIAPHLQVSNKREPLDFVLNGRATVEKNSQSFLQALRAMIDQNQLTAGYGDFLMDFSRKTLDAQVLFQTRNKEFLENNNELVKLRTLKATIKQWLDKTPLDYSERSRIEVKFSKTQESRFARYLDRKTGYPLNNRSLGRWDGTIARAIGYEAILDARRRLNSYCEKLEQVRESRAGRMLEIDKGIQNSEDRFHAESLNKLAADLNDIQADVDALNATFDKKADLLHALDFRLSTSFVPGLVAGLSDRLAFERRPEIVQPLNELVRAVTVHVTLQASNKMKKKEIANDLSVIGSFLSDNRDDMMRNPNLIFKPDGVPPMIASAACSATLAKGPKRISLAV